jgi:hypothetical protein
MIEPVDGRVFVSKRGLSNSFIAPFVSFRFYLSLFRSAVWMYSSWEDEK